MLTKGRPHSKGKDEQVLETTPEPTESAKEAGLRYVNDAGQGIRRRRAGKGFSYIDEDSKPIHDPDELKRIKSLGIPPAWTDVWISPTPRGHIQATGRDAKGRKQYRYHARWREVRDETKYERMMAFGKALSAIRKRVKRDMERSGLSREKVLAAVVRLLDTSFIRVGNEEYARDNRSFGLTTMRDRHVDISGERLRFEFRGKSGKQHTVDLKDRRLAKIVKQCQDVPGQELFQYVDEEGERQTINSEDVNYYLREITGQDFTAKDFRTWAGTVLAAMALQEFEEFDTEAQAKKNIVQAIESVAERLGNTPTICRKCYVHPEIIASYMDGSMPESLKQSAERETKKSLHDLSPEEAAVLSLLRRRLEG